MQCLEYCPENYRADETRRACVELWTVIGYQDTAFNETQFIDETLDQPAAKKTNRFNHAVRVSKRFLKSGSSNLYPPVLIKFWRIPTLKYEFATKVELVVPFKFTMLSFGTSF